MPDGEITRAARSKSKTSFSLLPDKLSPLHILRATPSHKRSFPVDVQTSIIDEMLHSSSLSNTYVLCFIFFSMRTQRINNGCMLHPDFTAYFKSCSELK